MVGAIAAGSSAENSRRTPLVDGPGGSYTVRRGDTMSQIAQRTGVSLEALTAANPQIRNPSLIFAGDRITIPGNEARHVVARGDTFGAIARANGLSVARLQAANPQLVNPDRIYPGDVIAIPVAPRNDIARPDAARVDTPAAVRPAPQRPAADAVAGTGAVTASGLRDGTLSLSAQDVTDLKKTLQTEWVQSAGDAQAKGIVDTILNRQASGRWGDTVADVVNARNQFSDINGPISRRDGRNSVDDLPASRISARVDRLVDTYLAERAAGTPSSIGDHLNYANPNFSDRVNLGWIMALDGPVLGRGNAIHRHGTTPDLQAARPGDFAVRLP